MLRMLPLRWGSLPFFLVMPCHRLSILCLPTLFKTLLSHWDCPWVKLPFLWATWRLAYEICTLPQPEVKYST